MQRLMNLARYLRDPEKGCPWDRQQTMESFVKNLTDEADEVVRAIERKDYPNLKEELGDTLFNLVFLINLAEEQGLFTLEDVIEGIRQKMINRHPHVFGGEKASDASEAIKLFYKAKKEEKEKESIKDRQN